VALYELLEKFQVLYKVQPVLSTLEMFTKNWKLSTEVLKNSKRNYG